MGAMMRQFLENKLGYAQPEQKTDFWNTMFTESQGNKDVAMQSLMTQAQEQEQSPQFTQGDLGETFSFEGNPEQTPTEAPQEQRGFMEKVGSVNGFDDAMINAGAALLSGKGLGGGLTAFTGTLDKEDTQAQATEQQQFQNQMKEKGFGLQEDRFGLQKEQFGYNQERDGVRNEQWQQSHELQQKSTNLRLKKLMFDIDQAKDLAPYQKEKMKAEALLSYRKATDPTYGKGKVKYSKTPNYIVDSSGNRTGKQVVMGDDGIAYDIQTRKAYGFQEGETVDPTVTKDNVQSKMLAWRDEKTGVRKQLPVVVKNGVNYFKQHDGTMKPVNEALTSKEFNTRRFINSSDAPDVEAGAGGIPNAVGYSEKLNLPTFRFDRESEQKAYSMTFRQVLAETRIGSLQDKMVEDGHSLKEMTSLSHKFLEWAAKNTGKHITASVINEVVGDTLPQKLQSDYSKFLQGVLRNDTGAAYTETEITDYFGSFMPSAGDTLDTIQYKRNGRIGELMGQIPKTGAGAEYLSGLLEGSISPPLVMGAQGVFTERELVKDGKIDYDSLDSLIGL